MSLAINCSCLLKSVIATSWLLFGCPGCAVFGMANSRVLYNGQVDDEQVLRLVQEEYSNEVIRGYNSNYTQLVVSLVSKGDTLLSRCIETRRFDAASELREAISREPATLEGRKEITNQRMWIVDNTNCRTIATFDYGTQKATGPNGPHPEWANPREGIVIKNIAP